MPAYTTVLGLYKAGGGSTGQVTPDEVVDVDKLNGNFDRLDGAVGLGSWTTSTRPILPFLGQSGYNSTLDTIERWSGATWLTVLPKYLQGGTLGGSYYTQTQLTSGALDGRYYTQAQLVGGQLNSLYPSKSAAGSVSQFMLPFKVAASSTSCNATTADGDGQNGGHNGFSGTVTVTATGLTTVGAVVPAMQVASSYERKISVKSIVGNVITFYLWSSNSVTGIGIQWIAIGT